MGNNLSPYSKAIGDEKISFLTPHFKILKAGRMEDGEILNTNESSVNPFDYHVSKCRKDSFKNIRIYKIHSNFDSYIFFQKKSS